MRKLFIPMIALLKNKTLLIILFLAHCVFLSPLFIKLFLFRGPALPVETLPSTGILDIHVHVAGLGGGNSGCFVSDSIRSSYKLRFYLGAFGADIKELETRGDDIIFSLISRQIEENLYVKSAIILALDGPVKKDGTLDQENTEIYVPNEFVERHTKLFSNLYFGASINPYRNDALERLEAAIKAGTKLIKWIPSIQMIDPSDPLLAPFYKKLAEGHIPLLSHTGKERAFTRSNDSYADPQKLRLALETGVTVIAAHLASTGTTDGQDNTERLLSMFQDFPNLYADISSLTQINKLGYLERALKDPRTRGRLVYGTDYPLINMVLVSPFYFPLNLTFQQMFSIRKVQSPWDRDVLLKQSLGVPRDVFELSSKLFENVK